MTKNKPQTPVPGPVNAGFDASSVPRNPSERGVRKIRAIHVLDDFIGLCISYLLAYLLRFGFNLDPLRVAADTAGASEAAARSHYAVSYVLSSPLYILCLFAPLCLFYAISGMYEGDRRLRHTPLMWNLLVANAVLLAAMATALYFQKDTFHMRGFLPLVLILNVPCTWVARRVTNAVVDHIRRRRGTLLLRSILVGEGAAADWLQSLSDQGRLKGHRIVARFPTPKTPGETESLIASAAQDRIATLFLLPKENTPDTVRQTILGHSVRAGLESIVLFPRFLRLHNPFEYGDSVHGVPLVHFSMAGRHFAPSPLRTALERVAAALGLVVVSPILLAAAVAIKLDDGGPVFFSQDRYGLGAKKFRMWKFRTMCVDAEARLAALKDRNETDGALFKMHDDPRVTRVGRFLRRTSIDELPQLFNVLCGQMRFVGPRPLPCSDIEPYLGSWQGFRQSVPPGITCIWQVTGRSDIGFDSMALLDVWYALNRNWMLDARILIRTAWAVLFTRGAY